MVQLGGDRRVLLIWVGEEETDEAAHWREDEGAKMEQVLLVRERHTFEFYRKGRRTWIFRCEEWREGCNGKWCLFDKDVRGIGRLIEDHNINSAQHKWRGKDWIDRKTQLVILSVIDMSRNRGRKCWQ